MRVGVDRQKYSIQLPLPPKIDPSVTMMQVEEKPDVTYSDVGGCKEQIERLREVVEVPLLSVQNLVSEADICSLNDLLTLVSILQRASCCIVHQEQERPCVQEPLPIERMLHSFVSLVVSLYRSMLPPLALADVQICW